MIRAITIPDRLIERVAAGPPQVRLEEIPAAQVAAEPGRPLELVGSRGEFLGRGIADPENGLIRILTHDPAEQLDAGFPGGQEGDVHPFRGHVLPALQAVHGWTQEKLEGLTIGSDGQVYAVTDNDGLKDATGETVFLRLAAAGDIF